MRELSYKASIQSRTLVFEFCEYEGDEIVRRHIVSAATQAGSPYILLSTDSAPPHQGRAFYVGNGAPSDEALEIFAHGFLKNILDNENDN